MFDVPNTRCGKMKNAWKVAAAATFLTAIALVACAPTPASIEITPSDVVVNVAEDAPVLAARILDDQGREVPEAKAVWSTSAADVVEVDPATGALTAKASGTAEITATVGEVKGVVAVTVALYKTLKLDAAAVTMKVGEPKALAAVILDEKDQPIDGEIAWASDNEKVVAVGPKGDLKAIAAGSAVVTATAKALIAGVKVEVLTPGPESLKAAADALDLKVGKTGKVEVQTLGADGQPAAGFVVSYASADPAIATVAADGTVTAVAAGETTVTATCGDKSVPFKVTVK
jgi:uncharacterized protein YjdB